MRTVADHGGPGHDQQGGPALTALSPRSETALDCAQPVDSRGTDRLTGLADRWRWDLRAPQIHDDAIQRGQPVAVLFVDLNDFTQVNDRYGHVAGDAVLHAAGIALRKMNGWADLIARYGGDEFRALAAGTDALAAVALAECVCDGLAAMSVDTQNTETSSVTIRDITASVGVAVRHPDDQSSLHNLMLVAGNALRRAKLSRRWEPPKRSGRSQVCLAKVASRGSITAMFSG